MLKVKVITVGSIKEKYLREASAEYVKRISGFASVEVVRASDINLFSRRRATFGSSVYKHFWT